jgi:type VI secretion system protein VasG
MEPDLRLLIARLGPVATRCLEAAAGIAVGRGHAQVQPEHLLSAILAAGDTDAVAALHALSCDPARVQASLERTFARLRGGGERRPVFSPELVAWLADAWQAAGLVLGHDRIRTGALLVALDPARRRVFDPGVDGLLPDGLHLDLRRRFAELVRGSAEETVAAAVPGAADADALARWCTDLTAQAKAGKLDPVLGREREIRQCIDTLCRRRKNNPILVGDAGVGKTAVVEGLALAIAGGRVPAALRDVRILSLDLARLQAGAGVRGAFEERLRQVIEGVQQGPTPAILFIDEAHTLIGAGGQAGTGDAANLLKPALARGELRTVAATTWGEYRRHIEKDPALARRFQPVSVPEPDIATTVAMLSGLRERYATAHGVTITDDAIAAAAELGAKHVGGRQHPDKGIDLIDTAAARARVGAALADPPPTEAPVVDRTTVAAVVADWTGVPVGNLMRDEAEALLRFEDRLRARVLGQDHALTAVGRALRASAAGLRDPRRPIGVFLLVGPSGVGKTETARGTAERLFGDERALTVVNLSEFQERHAVARLIGAPPGYVGYGEGGMLTESVRRRPYQAILLDEIEKADPHILDLFYQVFDAGVLNDGEGRTVDFSHTVVFLASNLASEVIAAHPGATPVELGELIRPILSRHLKPALVARMQVVPYLPLDAERLRAIASIRLDRLAKRLAEVHRVAVTVDEALVEALAARCNDPDSGARAVDHVIDGWLVPHLSEGLLQRLASGAAIPGIRLGVRDGAVHLDWDVAPASGGADGQPQTAARGAAG